MHNSGRFETRTEHLLQKLRQVSVPRGTFLPPYFLSAVLGNAGVVGYGHRVTASRRGALCLGRHMMDAGRVTKTIGYVPTF